MESCSPDGATRHEALIASMTGGMTRSVPAFAGSERFHSDGRPKGAFRESLRRIPDGRNALTVTGSVLFPVVVVVAAVAVSHPVGWVVAFLLMSVAQNRLFILHHEAAHRVLFSDRRVNDLVGINLIGWLTFGTGGQPQILHRTAGGIHVGFPDGVAAEHLFGPGWVTGDTEVDR